MATEEKAAKGNPGWKILLVAVPVFLALSGAFAMWSWWKGREEAGPDPRLALAASEVRARDLDDHLYKLRELIERRDWNTPAGRRGLRQSVAFIEGTLSPQNYGFAVQRGEDLSFADELWPTIWVDLRGSESEREVLLVAAAYDGEAAGIAAVLGAVNDLRDERMGRTVRFVFFPAALHAGEEGREISAALPGGESGGMVLRPELPADAERAGGADLVPVAQALVDKVRELARAR
jgi:hypothetical protein